jgi:plasmid maintenance system antidote protein VapI
VQRLQRLQGGDQVSDRDPSAIYREQAQTIGQHLAECIASAGLSNADAACELQVHEATISAWLNGRHKPATRLAKRIQRVFPGMVEVFALHGMGELRISRRRPRTIRSRRAARPGKAHNLTGPAERRRLYLIEERHRVMQARRKREERNANEQEA